MHYLVLGVGTDIGKTYFIEQYCAKFANTFAIKPIATGFDYNDPNSDSARILKALGLEFTQQNLDLITPYRHHLPVSPHFVLDIDLKTVADFCWQHMQSQQNLLIESAGGVMTPINKQANFLDLAVLLNIECILITDNYLGAISHTLTALDAIKNRGIACKTIVVNQRYVGDTSIDDFIETLKNFTSGIDILKFPLTTF
jgi:dethiobiotin synthetase